MGLFIEKPTPFVPEFLNRMMQLDYPKKRIDLLVHNTVGILSAIYFTYISQDSKTERRNQKLDFVTCHDKKS